MTRTIAGDNLVLSVPQMDREHAELIALADEFSAAVDAGASRAELEVRLTKLLEKFRGHFQSEEDLMRSFKFPGLNRHIEEHARLIGQMVVLCDGLETGGIRLCEALSEFVLLWTGEHIQGPDTAFAFFYHQEVALRQAGAGSGGQ